MAKKHKPQSSRGIKTQRAVQPSTTAKIPHGPVSEKATPPCLHIKGFLDRLRSIEAKSPDSSLLFVLGSGASRPSNIKTGGEMVADWIGMLYKEDVAHETVARDKWPTAVTLDIPSFNPMDPAASYPEVFARTYNGRRKEGFDYLENEIAGRDPSYGYSVLAQILADTRHNVVVTTNFDNLVIDALSIYTTSTPLICGHESLAGFIRTKPSRPQVVKVHRDLFYAPKNTSDELGALPPQFADALKALFATHVPIVIGYGGNDGSLLHVLEEIERGGLQQGLYWCYRSQDPQPRQQILDMVARHNGWLVPIKGFDELMIELQDALKLAPLDAFLATRGEERARNYKERRDLLAGTLAPATQPAKTGKPQVASGDASQTADVLSALQSVLERNKGTRTAQQWDSLARLEPDPQKKAMLYTAGLQTLPKSAWMHVYAAQFFASTQNTLEQAHNLHKEAVSLAPQDPGILGNYANFLRNVRKDPDEVEAMYKRAFEADPKHTINLGNYANFLWSVRKDRGAAEAMYKRALEADPKHTINLGNYANFLRFERKSPDAAEAMYKRALEAEPKHTNSLCNYANFLRVERKNPDAAEAMYRRALEADPKHAAALGNYANLLRFERRSPDEAEAMYKRAVAVDPKHAMNLGNYADFLMDVRKDHDAAEAMYKRALEAEPKHVNILGNYARFLLANDRLEDGLRTLDFALDALGPDATDAIAAELWMYATCHWLPDRWREALVRLKSLLIEMQAKTGDWDFSGVIESARRRGHVDAQWLNPLAKVCAGTAPPSTLEPWEPWHAVK